MSEQRLPDGTIVFICGRRTSLSSAEKQSRWVVEEAVKQGRCPLCLSKVEEIGGHSAVHCRRPPVTGAQAVAILRGMVAG